ncbi:hypothetical protein HDV05_002589 [Chytridiales sp. JEL 0842]|nr:hypothetical protein HDV05_002589 [Chytridiales sp. JEL 0842]
MEIDESHNPPYDFNMLNWFGAEVQKVGGMLELTMAPTTVPMDNLSEATLEALAKQCRDINYNRGVPIFLRWGHEMNGDWTLYGYKPEEYKRSFRRITNIVRKYTNMTAMVWAPNVGTAYVFSPGANLSPPPGPSSPEFRSLDTNGDGIFNQNDDPYGPYYPGDDVVDWVGISLYYYPLQEVNEPVPPTYFRDTLTGSGDTIQYVQNLSTLQPTWYDLQNFYKRFAEDKRKPMMFPETGAPFLANLPANAGELAIKEAWWRQMFSDDTIRSFPWLKLFVYFEETKTLNSHVRNWAVTVANDTRVLPAFVNYMSGFSSKLVSGDRMKVDCSGAVTF